MILEHLVPVRNPQDRVRMQAIGLGLAVMGTGFALSGIYDQRSYAAAGAVIGILMAVIHWDGPPQVRRRP